MPRVTPTDTSTNPAMAPATTPPNGTPLRPPGDTPEIIELRTRLAHAEHRAAIAEAIATEREHTATAERRRADTLEHALRLLEPPRTPDPQPTELAPIPPRSRRPWWRRHNV